MKLKSLRSSRLGAGAATAALIGAAVLVPASAARAGTEPPIIAGLYCNSWGANQFFCSMSVEGGISPWTSYWSGAANVSGFGSHGESYTLGTCTTQGLYTQVNVVVSDGYGYYSAQSSFGFTCA
ncbi:hypothetical protein [Catenulispora rubra]|uniref:hypothetical protein n=1 Tax=Catenulispora rubra TaxID=280293 RepID=UPI0018922352|nr:hypothetical protein [Catenulispora rubra]